MLMYQPNLSVCVNMMSLKNHLAGVRIIMRLQCVRLFNTGKLHDFPKELKVMYIFYRKQEF